MSSYTQWIPFELACRLRCLQQGSLNVGNTRQNIANLQALAITNANGARTWAKWGVLRAAGTAPVQYLLIFPANVPGFVKPFFRNTGLLLIDDRSSLQLLSDTNSIFLTGA